MFDFFKNLFTKETVKYKTLVSSIDTAFNNFYQLDNSANLLAETGKTRQQLLDIVKNDDEVTACIEDVATAIKAKQWKITGLDVSEDVINRLYKIIRNHIDTFVDLTITAMLNGYSVAEYVFRKEDDGFITIDKVLNKDGELDFYQPLRDGNLLFTGEGEHKLCDIIQKRLLLTNKAVPARPSGEMSVIKAYPAVAIRKKNLAYTGQFISRYAQPYVVGKNGSANIDNDNNRSFTSILYGFINGGATGIGKDDSIELHQLSGNGEAFDTIEQLANRRIQKLILGKVKQSEMKSGSRASQETDDKIRHDRINAYLNMMIRAVSHALNAILLVNEQYGLSINAPQGLWFEYFEQKKTDKTQAEVDKIYSETGIKFTEQYYLDLGYEKEHFTLAKTTPSPPTPKQQNLALSDNQSLNQAISHSPIGDRGEGEQDFMQPKIDMLLSLVNECQDYDEFEKRLFDVEFDNDDLVAKLAKQCADEYVRGIKGE